ncbi:hypothetical protein [Stenotrophomonas sp. NPDC078853]|uniref:hypothetical protein n=1 Tax=Stenotrophomonas sp. NPDC078853 TaxID=3364534 RepID=UPI00384D4F7F
MTPQLFLREPRRMKQPRKDALREQLVIAAQRIEQLARENLALRDTIDRACAELGSAVPDPTN